MFLEYFVPYYWTCYRRRPLCGKTGPTSFLSSCLTTKEHIISYSNSSGKMVKLMIFLKDILEGAMWWPLFVQKSQRHWHL